MLCTTVAELYWILFRLAYKSSFESWAGSKKNIHDVSENRARSTGQGSENSLRGHLQLRRSRKTLGKSRFDLDDTILVVVVS